MELSISDADAKAIGLDSPTKERIVDLVHQHLGHASVAFVELVDEPCGVKVEAVGGTMIIDRDLIRRIDN